MGVDIAFESVPATEQLIDQVSSYTNIIVLGCSKYYDLTRLTTLSQYVYDKGLSFIVYSDVSKYPSSQWLADAAANMAASFWEFTGMMRKAEDCLTNKTIPVITSAQNYSDAATKYIASVNRWVRGPHSIAQNFAYPTQYQLFTSDYAFYWYDYQAGYDTVFAEFGANYSRQINVALCRGAATAMGKDWGVMMTWTYTQPPYIESGAQILQ